MFELMANDDAILKAIESLRKDMATKSDLEPINKKLDGQDSAIAHMSTAVKTLATKQDVETVKTELKADIKKVRAEMATKADVLGVGVKINKMKRRIEIIEEDANLPNPHEN